MAIVSKVSRKHLKEIQMIGESSDILQLSINSRAIHGNSGLTFSHQVHSHVVS